MNNTFAYSREMEIALSDKLTKRMEGACLSVMRYCVLHANHSPGYYAGQPIGRGEIVASRDHLMAKTGLPEKTIRNALTQLEKVKSIRKKGAIEGANGTALYLIENYELWDALSEKGPSEGPARGQQGARSKEGKEEERTRESDKSLSRLNGKKSFKALLEKHPEAGEIIKSHWTPFAPLPPSVEKSESAKARIIDQLRLIHEQGKVPWSEIGHIVEYAAQHWQPAGYCDSPASLYGWTKDKTCRRYEKIQQQMAAHADTTPSTADQNNKNKSLEEMYLDERDKL